MLVGDVKIVSPISTCVLNTFDTQIKWIFFLRAPCYISRGSQWGGSFDRLNFRAFDGLWLLSGNLAEELK